MSMQNIVDKILSDASAEAQAIVSDAESKAAQLLAEASLRAEKLRRETEEDVKRKTESIFEKKAASARLESAKLQLKEKRKAVDSVYALALDRLISLEKEDCLRLTASLLERYAEKGDELFFAENFKYASEVKLLPVVKEKGLKISQTRLSLDGGMKLVGEISDKDLSYGALLSFDREEYQAELARELFK